MSAGSFTPLTPLAFLERSADVFADKTAIAYGARRTSYREFGAEATRLAHALRASGVRPGDRVAYMCPNIPEMLVANFGEAGHRAILHATSAHCVTGDTLRPAIGMQAARCRAGHGKMRA